MPDKNDPDGPLYKWGKADGVEYAKNVTPGQKGKVPMKKFKQFSESDQTSGKTDTKKPALFYTDAERKKRNDAFDNVKKIALQLQREKEKREREQHEEVEQVDEGIDKSSKIYQEYLKLKKMPVKQLRNMVAQANPGDDVRGYDKAGAIAQILRDRHGNRKVNKAMGFGESVEQVDELNKTTLQSYAKKAASDAKDERDYADYNKKQASQHTGTLRNARLRSAQTAAQRAKKREAGVALAKKKMGEEVQQVDELTKKTIQRYQDQAALHHRDAKAAGATEIQKRREKGYDLADKKLAGKTKVGATGKLSEYPYRKEEVDQIDELSSGTLKSYIKKADKKAAKARNSYSMAAGRRSDFADDTPAMKKNADLAKKREDGIDAAKKKLNKEEVEESTAAYGKSQSDIRRKNKHDAMTSSDKSKLGALAALMKKQKKINEASLKMRIAKKGKVENELKKLKSSSGEMAAFLLNQSADNDTKDLKAFLKSRDADKDVLQVFKKHMPELLK